MATENQRPLTAPQLLTHAQQPENNCKTAKPHKDQVELNSNRGLTKGVNRKMTENASQRSAQLAPSNTLKTSASSISRNALHQKKATSTTQQSPGAEVDLESMNLLSLKEPCKASRAAPTMQGNLSKPLNGKRPLSLPFMFNKLNIYMIYLYIFPRRVNASNTLWFVFLLVIP